MEKIAKYLLLHCPTFVDSMPPFSENNLDEEVEVKMEEGFQPYGNPFYGDNGVYQAMVKLEADDGL
jgi:hypothetical protein